MTKTNKSKKGTTYSSINFLTEKEFSVKERICKNQSLRIVHFTKNLSVDFDNNQPITSITIPSFGNKKYEVWDQQSSLIKSVDEKYDVFLSKSKDITYLRINSPEDSDSGLESPSYNAYYRLFSFLSKYPTHKLLRIWNYIPNILGKDNNLERYHQFNIGRFNAWQSLGPKGIDGHNIYPAATGIGMMSGPIILECLTTTHPVYYLQNPRQTPSHLYSKKYGPLPPVFARGSLHLAPSGAEIYISGTASLIGENAVWIGNPQMQARETLKNIKALIGEDNLKQYGQAGFKLGDLYGVRVYIKHYKHLKIIKGEIEKYLPTDRIIYLHDDICRSEWLLEIEAVAKRS